MVNKELEESKRELVPGEEAAVVGLAGERMAPRQWAGVGISSSFQSGILQVNDT